MLKLNLGCGQKKISGFINIDKSPDCLPDQIMDLEVFPWPFADNSAVQIVLYHILEHTGQSLEIFKAIIQEIYRIACADAHIHIKALDPYHDDALSDPSYCRPIIPQMLHLFSRKHLWKHNKNGAATPLAIMWGVDFDIINSGLMLDDQFKAYAKSQNIPLDMDNIRYYKNASRIYDMTLQAIKPARIFNDSK